MDNTAQNLYTPNAEPESTESQIISFLTVAIGLVVCVLILIFVFLAGTWYAEAKVTRQLLTQTKTK